MLRTVAMLILLLGVATATPVVCLCAPDGVIGLIAQPVSDDTGHPAALGHGAATNVSDTSSVIAAGAAATVVSVVATASGVPSTAPWRLRRVTATLVRPGAPISPSGQVWSPATLPPRAA